MGTQDISLRSFQPTLFRKKWKAPSHWFPRANGRFRTSDSKTISDYKYRRTAQMYDNQSLSQASKVVADATTASRCRPNLPGCILYQQFYVGGGACCTPSCDLPKNHGRSAHMLCFGKSEYVLYVLYARCMCCSFFLFLAPPKYLLYPCMSYHQRILSHFSVCGLTVCVHMGRLFVFGPAFCELAVQIVYCTRIAACVTRCGHFALAGLASQAS